MHITENQVKCVNVNDVQYVEKLYFPNFFAPSFTLTNICLEDNECTRFRLRRYICKFARVLLKHFLKKTI